MNSAEVSTVPYVPRPAPVDRSVALLLGAEQDSCGAQSHDNCLGGLRRRLRPGIDAQRGGAPGIPVYGWCGEAGYGKKAGVIALLFFSSHGHGNMGSLISSAISRTVYVCRVKRHDGVWIHEYRFARSTNCIRIERCDVNNISRQPLPIGISAARCHSSYFYIHVKLGISPSDCCAARASCDTGLPSSRVPQYHAADLLE